MDCELILAGIAEHVEYTNNPLESQGSVSTGSESPKSFTGYI